MFTKSTFSFILSLSVFALLNINANAQVLVGASDAVQNQNTDEITLSRVIVIPIGQTIETHPERLTLRKRVVPIEKTSGADSSQFNLSTIQIVPLDQLQTK